MTMLMQAVPIIGMSLCGVMTLTVLHIRLAILVGEQRTELDALRLEIKSSKQAVNAILNAHAMQIAALRRCGHFTDFSDN